MTNFLIQNLYMMVIGSFGIGAFASLLFPKNDRIANLIGNAGATLGSGIGIIFSLYLLFTQSTINTSIPTTFPFLRLSIYIDSLAAFFFLIICTIAFACSLYGFGYMKHYFGKYNISSFSFFYNIFIASLLLVVTASNSIYFLVVWEIMSLTSYFLVIYEHHKRDSIQAGLLYLVMTHFGTLFILLAFLGLFIATGSFDFQTIKAHKDIPLFIQNLVFLSALIGFGTKAGIIPLHIWLPRAHPAAPSHVSALMSGVMIKTAIYMLMRLLFDILPAVSLWWGPVILLVGAISSLLGVLYALAEHDIKRLLAYHSVENIGIILLGLGSAVTFLALGFPGMAIVSSVAALYHTMNHAVFKSLLFLGAGSVVSQTHTGNMEEYGGLIKRMPYTAFFFLVGCMGISALPPLNGFASEWITFQSLLAGIAATSVLIKIVFAISLASLAFTGGLAAACFVKAFGVTFLAKPRSAESTHAKESNFWLHTGMIIPASLVLMLGIFAGSINPALAHISQQLQAFQSVQVIPFTNTGFIQVANRFAFINLLSVFLIMISILISVVSVVYLLTRKQKVTISRTWDCGTPSLTARTEITATAFSRSLITMFGGILKPTKQHEIEYSDADSRYFAKSKTIILETPNLYELKVYRPLQNIIGFLANQSMRIQSGNINQYLLYIFITLVSLLIIARYYP